MVLNGSQGKRGGEIQERKNKGGRGKKKKKTSWGYGKGSERTTPDWANADFEHTKLPHRYL